MKIFTLVAIGAFIFFFLVRYSIKRFKRRREAKKSLEASGYRLQFK